MRVYNLICKWCGFGQWIQRCKCRIGKSKCVTFGFERLLFDMTDVVCVKSVDPDI